MNNVHVVTPRQNDGANLDSHMVSNQLIDRILANSSHAKEKKKEKEMAS